MTLARAEGTLRSGAGEVGLAGAALEVESPPVPPEHTLRSIAVVLADGALLAVSALAPQGSAGHGDEEIEAVMAEPEAASEPEDPRPQGLPGSSASPRPCSRPSTTPSAASGGPTWSCGPRTTPAKLRCAAAAP